MQDFLTAMGQLFSFVLTQLGAFGTFLTSNILGQLVLGSLVLSLVVWAFTAIISLFNK